MMTAARFARTVLPFVVIMTAIAGAQEPAGKPLQTIKGGVLDEIRIYSTSPPPRTAAVAARPFSATDADLAEGGQKGELKEETKDLQQRGPRLLLNELVTKLEEAKAFTKVTVLDAGSPVPEGVLVVDGRFTLIDPGSRAKRYFVGFGAGKSGVAVAGSVKSADGTLLATFVQKRIGVMGMGGGDSTKKLESDATSIGEDIAKFLAAWSTGKKLK
jgi:hypothetical protein